MPTPRNLTHRIFHLPFEKHEGKIDHMLQIVNSISMFFKLRTPFFPGNGCVSHEIKNFQSSNRSKLKVSALHPLQPRKLVFKTRAKKRDLR